MDGWLEFTLTAAFLAGLTGGVHCAAMCGPLIGIACGGRERRQSDFSAEGRGNAAAGKGRAALTPFLRQAIAYNAGRIASYCAAGALTGALGAAGLGLRGGPAAQQLLLAVMSVSLILLAGYVAGITAIARGIEAAGGPLWRRIEPYSRRFLPASTPARAFGLGVVWGWLPCGMVYLALIAALATADPVHGALVLAAFGLGTLPNLLAISAWLGYVTKLAKGRRARSITAAVIAAVGLAGIAKAAQPAVVSAAGSWCLQIPGIASLLGGG